MIANAGSGKTHVLTQRVIRLLLSGVDPAAILCLTFTKVAAAEMSRRVFRDLGAWTSHDDATLAAEITELQNKPTNAAEMRQARRLFAKALETPGGLKIQTIHAFCERLLHAFPFEANVPGQFQVMDEAATAAALAAARETVMNEAASTPDAPLGRAVRALAETTADQQICEALDALIARRDDLRRWMENAAPDGETGSIDDALADLRRRLDLKPDESEESVCREMCDAPGWSRADCATLLAGLSDSLVTAPHQWNERAHPSLAAVVKAETASAESNARLDFFLSFNSKEKVWRPHSQRFSSDFVKSVPGLKQRFASEGDRLIALVGRLDFVRAYEATSSLLIVGDAILGAYHQAKRRAGALDFSDLIVKTRNLLSRSDAAQWVLFKLDSRIEHILVDEAQDTSPDQWLVVKAIAEDFFSGEGAARAPRTIFAVGDDKQSIFRFQGAVPAMLTEMQDFFDKRITEAGQSFVVKPLYLSFRSTREVLEAVDMVFEPGLAAEITSSTYSAHASNRPHEPGHVVLLPRAVRKKREEPEDWTEPFTAPSAAETELAGTIAEEVLRIRDTLLPSGRRVTESGILILVRRRDAFAAAMNRALLARGIATAGADRIPVAKHIAVLDLLALADVALLPEDDLQLAALLKSPLLGVGEEALMHLAAGRKGSLWRALRDVDDLELRAAAETLRRWRRMADQVAPFRFFATVLGPDQGRRVFRARLGGEVDDVLDAFLSQALAYEATEPPSLHGFLRFVRANESDIKREAEEGTTGVRVMTVHGAKGLEADVVFLADTGGAAVVHQLRKPLVDIGRERDDPAFLWRRVQSEAPEAQRRADEREDRETESEYLRLLYVAMTRARDVFYMAGVKSLLKQQPRTWYSIVAGALLPPDIERDQDDELAAPYLWPPEQRPPIEAEVAPSAVEQVPADLPRWLIKPALPAPHAPEPLRPSSGLAEPDPPPATGTEGAAPGDGARLRGRIMHVLLEILPRLPASDRPRAAERLLAGELPRDPSLAESIRREADAVLAAPAL